jgi:hypothetical protein
LSSQFQNQQAIPFYIVSYGNISASSSVLSISTNNLVVGQNLSVTITPFDSYGNPISNANVNVLNQLSVQYASLRPNDQANIKNFSSFTPANNYFLQ